MNRNLLLALVAVVLVAAIYSGVRYAAPPSESGGDAAAPEVGEDAAAPAE